MYYLTERCVTANKTNAVLNETADLSTNPSMCTSMTELPHQREAVFSQADLWNVQKHMKAIHVTDRFPRTWEGI
ncbi:MAG: hypothetical protein IM584_13780 [Chitinophagaceae bacterium]|nr:hypothetical protein [Chitinophagaceae bacterium]MEA3427001.1 hypothetical protein [Bacteroidota bacterium]MCA6453350.1 hypothetical protein [Chitinophagaceae bacterium]MCA6457195.1 hypothetical protein [Chitinophagaceae bacterium]MCA6457906.1 hypothetical protein [Chitinophagaceae bacterium]